MRSFNLRQMLLAVMGALATASASAALIPTQAVTVDGNLSSDWGVVVAPNNGSNMQPGGSGVSSPACTGAGVLNKPFQRCEDTNDLDAGGAVGPYSGGQNYDVEFLGMTRTATKLYFALATGQRPDNGLSYYSPGDLFLTVNGFKWVVEMGGGAGGAANNGQVTGAAGNTYVLNGNGVTTAVTGTANAGQTVGSMWRTVQGVSVATPIAGPYDDLGVDGKPLYPVQFKANVGQNALGTATVVSTGNSLSNGSGASLGSGHQVWEIGIDLSIFNFGSGTQTIAASWGPSCYNDVLQIEGTLETGSSSGGQSSGGGHVPEPASLGLFGLAILGLGVARRRKAA